MPLSLNRITPRGGSPLELGKFTVLVGPNNSGKSQTLRDIRDYIVSGSTQRLTILDDLDVSLPTKAEGTSQLSLLPNPMPGHVRILGVASDLQRRHDFSPSDTWIDQQFAQMQHHPGVRAALLANMGQYWCAFLDAESRFRLAAAAESYDTRSEAPSNALQAFFSGGASVAKNLRTAFKEAFGMDIALDWAAMRRLYLKVGPDFGSIPDTRAELDALLRDAQQLADQGDGYKSFAGVLLAVLAFPNRLLLLDEPEAFLHPAQARTLGRWLAGNAKEREAQIVVASHSADFLLGVISADADATIVRLNRNVTGTTFRVIPPATTSGLTQSPLLSSQPVLDSLFHHGVVVCEGDPDRAIYQTVLHQFLRDRGGEEVLLIHSNGKDAVKSPLELLRSAGAPACAIVDIDILNSEKLMSDAVQALTGTPASAHMLELRKAIGAAVEKATEEQLLESMRESVRQWLESEHSDLRGARKLLVSSARIKSHWDDVKKNGVDYFHGEDRERVQELLTLLQGTGLFVVPCGELEGWMHLGIAKGQRWSRAALERLHAGACPEDLLQFMSSVADFLKVT